MSNVSGALSVLGQHTSAKSWNGRKAQQKRRRGADQKSILLAACTMKFSPYGKIDLYWDIIPLVGSYFSDIFTVLYGVVNLMGFVVVRTYEYIV